MAWPIALFILYLSLMASRSYRIGVGIYDVTGPAADVIMMGYAKLGQSSRGIHLRLFSRAFVIQETDQSRPLVFVSLDAGMTTQLIKIMVVKELARRFGPKFGHDNVLISSTHTHSGPGGYFQYSLYLVPSLGFVKESLTPIVRGIVQSIILAQDSITEGRIYIAEGDLHGASINRSPASYLLNPETERSKYSGDVDTKMTVLKFVGGDGRLMGMINWFAVHGVSMNHSNTLISGDNKGLASIMFEQKMNSNRLIGKGPFVAAFAQSNEGDVSPNTAGPRCIDTGLPCDFVHSTCNGRTENCIAFGPGADMFDSTKIIAKMQFEKAWELFMNAREELTGPLDFIHQFVNMTHVKVDYRNYSGYTCKPAMGYSFAAGTVDGPGDFDFTQGTKEPTIFWDLVRDLVKKPSPELIACQAPKPIILACGEMTFPYPWQPEIVETQLFRIGNLLIAAVPGEFTTMSGRRLREEIEQEAASSINDCVRNHPRFTRASFRSVVAGLSNVYTSYITTPEEYELQRYEGASTIYGRLTLPAYIQQYRRLTSALIKAEKLPPGPNPPFFMDKLISLIPGVLFDRAPLGHDFGDVLIQPNRVYHNTE
ncbi:unnamed protein product [Calicophoron daubneyi]|uniref:Neutral ceramidase n=1 Tax=Calicophoron daubneyi TaxID=300641 RepID=A0AAV2TLS3_CALDB